MADGGVTCITTLIVIISGLITYVTSRRLGRQQKEQLQKKIREGGNRRAAILQTLKWVHAVHEAVYFAEAFSHYAVAQGKMDASGWQNIAVKIERIGARPPQRRFLSEALSNAVSPTEAMLGELKTLIARHRRSLSLMACERHGLPAPSRADFQAAQNALARDLEDKARQFNVWVMGVENQLEEAFWATLQ